MTIEKRILKEMHLEICRIGTNKNKVAQTPDGKTSNLIDVTLENLNNYNINNDNSISIRLILLII